VTIALLRGGALLVNLACFLAAPWLLGAPLWTGVPVAALCFWGSWAYARRVPEGAPASPLTVSGARRLAERIGIPHPRFVHRVPGWTAGAVRVRGGYALVVGEEVDPEHRDALLAHELAHVALGDLDWEPWTDGVARALVRAVRKVPPLVVIACPFLVFGVPLARLTELRADDFAALWVPSYPAVIKEVASKLRGRSSPLYPSLEKRAHRSARRSLRISE